MFMTAPIMRDVPEFRQWVETRSGREVGHSVGPGLFFPIVACEAFHFAMLFVAPNADGRAVLEVEFLQDFLDVFFHRAIAAPKDRGDLVVTFAGGDPTGHFCLPRSQRIKRSRDDAIGDTI